MCVALQTTPLTSFLLAHIGLRRRIKTGQTRIDPSGEAFEEDGTGKNRASHGGYPRLFRIVTADLHVRGEPRLSHQFSKDIIKTDASSGV
jgi:hypothetical protein